MSEIADGRRREYSSTLGATTPLGVTDADALPVTRPSRTKIVWRLLFLLISAIALYGLLPQLLDVWAEIPKLRDLNPIWFLATFLLEIGSFVCQWSLTRTALPQVSWFVAGTSQLVSNAVSKVVPGGAAMGAATGYRMLSVSGVNRGTAGAALAGTAIVSNGVLFALPMVAVIGSIISAPVPSDLALIAWGGALLFLVLFAVVFTLVRFDRTLWAVGRVVERVTRWVFGKVNRPGGPTAAGMVHQRDAMVDALGSRWEMALAAAVGNWGLDYLALVAALYAVGAKPRLSLVLLAYGAAAVLSMIPITPGGLGFVEAGLTATLIAAGVTGSDALLATLAYRVVSYWLPLPAGLGASVLFRRRYGRVDLDEIADEPPSGSSADPGMRAGEG
ncbi:MAG: lysylphosphatidylglycerol synthase transmembrane domain-containing protein [Acidimicrobiales bacterium]